MEASEGGGLPVPGVSRGLISSLVFGRTGLTLAVEDGALRISGGQASECLSVSAMTEPASVAVGRVWSRLQVETASGLREFKGFRRVPLQQLAEALNGHLGCYVRKTIANEHGKTAEAAAQVTELLSLSRYARASRVARVLDVARGTSPPRLGELWNLYATEQQKDDAAQVVRFIGDWQQMVSAANKQYVAQQIEKHRSLFDTVESSPLTQSQREACVTDEDNNLVLAGAGTGKTSTMIGRAGYLLASGEAQPDQILMLAFAKKAAAEMQERQDSRLRKHARDGAPVVKTFHALGLDIIGRVEGTRPAISVLAEDSFALSCFIDDQLALQCVEPDYVADVLSWCFNRRFSCGNPFDFPSQDSYLEYVRTNELRSMRGELVKSYEEVVVANFLYAHGIEYEYERKYRIPPKLDHGSEEGGRTSREVVSDAEHRPYMPDFYLPRYGIYLEHFALNGDMKPPAGWTGYAAGVAWKRNLHAKYGTVLLETRSHMQHDGVLDQCLAAMLQASGVALAPRPVEELLDEIREKGDLKYLTEPLASFLGLLKQSDLELEDARALGAQQPDADRFDLFFMLFEPIFEAYERHLADCGEVDFSDMIGRAIGHVESGRYRSPYRHVLVDEFQDISALRARLARALVAQNAESVLFAVGDDWQAIYRFTGSDIGLTRDFETAFGPTATTSLDLTFRFNDKIGSVSSKFILGNPNQINKRINSSRHEAQAAVSLLPTSDPGIGLRLALAALDRRREQMGRSSGSVLVLGRYNYVVEPWLQHAERRRLAAEFPHLKVDCMTAHAAKGREADFVVVLGVEMGRNGFPAEKPSEPLMELLLPTAEDFKFAEERRLFYVALTRARHRVVLVYEPTLASSFVEEIAQRDEQGRLLYEVCVDEFQHAEGAGAHVSPVSCPRCHDGRLRLQSGPYGDFVGCIRFPYCRYTEPPCPKCGSVMRREQGMRVCVSTTCDEQSPVCPKCGGAMVRRTSAYGPFWGCINYKPNPGFVCTHTINIGSPYRKSKKYGYRASGGW